MLPYSDRLPNINKDWVQRRWVESIKFGCGGKGEIKSSTTVNKTMKIVYFLYSS